MVRAVEQIERELAALDQTVAAIAQAFHTTYQQYLTALGKAMRQQLVLAGYHICTHAYPEQFLALSLHQRQELQQALQQLAKQGQAELLECLQPIVADTNSKRLLNQSDAKNTFEETFAETFEKTGVGEEVAQQLTIQSDSLQLEIVDSSIPLPSEPQFQAESWSQNEASLDAQIAEPAASVDADLAEANPDIDTNGNNAANDRISNRPIGNPTPDPPDRPLQPNDIARWQTQIEERITEILQNLSHTTNRMLQQADILPSRLPEPVLEVAAKADLSSETANSPPNLLSLLIEASGENDEKPTMTPIVAIRLRLSEIEFSDAATAAVRSKLRQLMGQLVKLERDYQRKQKERAVAQAESAWRASWFEAES